MATTKLWTIEELEREGPPEGRWELIDGELVEMSPSGPLASVVASWIAHLL
jgi:Uma2 family endonuclease